MKSLKFLGNFEGLVNKMNSMGYGKKQVLTTLCTKNKCDLPISFTRVESFNSASSSGVASKSCFSTFLRLKSYNKEMLSKAFIHPAKPSSLAGRK